MFSGAALAKLWDGVVQLRRLEHIRHMRGLLGGCDAHTGDETSVGMLQAKGNN
jgi:hypothetical protein